MNRAVPDAPSVTTKPVPAALATIPVGPPGTSTVRGTFVPSPRYSVDLPVSLSATHHGEVGSAAIPQPLIRSASTLLPSTPLSDWSAWTVYEFADWMFAAAAGLTMNAIKPMEARARKRRWRMGRTSVRNVAGPPRGRALAVSTGRYGPSPRSDLGGASELLLVVDLGALQAPREVDVDRLPLGERVERGVTGLAVAVAGLLPAAEWQVRLGARRAGVDVDDARLEVAHRPEGRVRVAGEDRRRQAVVGLVERGHRLGVAIDRDDRQDRPEDLLLGDAVHRLHAGEDRRLEEVAVPEVAVDGRRPAENELALGSADVDVAADLLDRGGIDERPDFDGLVQAGAQLQASSPRLEPLQ